MGHFGGRIRCNPARSATFYAGGCSTAPARKRPTHDEIARLAYSYWEAGGRRDGAALEDWLRAERDLGERRG